MTWFKRHKHAWWLVDQAGYGPGGRMDTLLSWSRFTYVCRNDHTHIKQVELRGNQVAAAQAILQCQAAEQGGESIPDVYKKAWGAKP